jgi:hypothetical protein
MSKIIRNQNDIEGAELADIVASFNALTGQSLKRFSSRAVGESRLRMAILGAADAAAHLGVPKGAVAEPLTAEERAAKGEKVNPLAEEETRVEQERAVQASSTAVAPPDAPAPGEDTEKPSEVSYKPGSLAHQLDVATRAMAPIAPKDKKPKATAAAPRKAIARVELTGAGKSKLQVTSARHAIVEWIKATSATNKRKPQPWASMQELVEHFEASVKGHLQKLAFMNHVRLLDSDGKETS